MLIYKINFSLLTLFSLLIYIFCGRGLKGRAGYRQTEVQADKQTNKQTNRRSLEATPKHWRTDRQTYVQTHTSQGHAYLTHSHGLTWRSIWASGSFLFHSHATLWHKCRRTEWCLWFVLSYRWSLLGECHHGPVAGLTRSSTSCPGLPTIQFKNVSIVVRA